MTAKSPAPSPSAPSDPSDRLILRIGARESSFPLRRMAGDWLVDLGGGPPPPGGILLEEVLLGEIADGPLALSASFGAVEIIVGAFGRRTVVRLFPSPDGGSIPLLLHKGKLCPWSEAPVADLLGR